MDQQLGPHLGSLMEMQHSRLHSNLLNQNPWAAFMFRLRNMCLKDPGVYALPVPLTSLRTNTLQTQLEDISPPHHLHVCSSILFRVLLPSMRLLFMSLCYMSSHQHESFMRVAANPALNRILPAYNTTCSSGRTQSNQHTFAGYLQWA